MLAYFFTRFVLTPYSMLLVRVNSVPLFVTHSILPTFLSVPILIQIIVPDVTKDSLPTMPSVTTT